MSNIEGIEALHLTRNNESAFTLNAVQTTIITRVSRGFTEVTGIIKVVFTSPAGNNVSIIIQQGIDGSNYDHQDSYMVADGGVQAFAIKVVGTYTRVIATIMPGMSAVLRFGGLLKLGSAP
jgi:hypothetical protein